jgi:hypothetical protein
MIAGSRKRSYNAAASPTVGVRRRSLSVERRSRSQDEVPRATLRRYRDAPIAARESATLPGPGHDGLGRPMRRGRTLIWTIVGSVVAAVAVVVVLIDVNSGASPKAASSPAPSRSARTSPQAGESTPVVTPETSSTSSFSYLSDLKPSGDLAQQVTPGPVKISGSIYPKSISFYCSVGDPTPFPEYTIKHDARRFQATIGLPESASPQFHAGVMVIGDGRTLRTVTVSVLKPRTLDVSLKGVYTLQLECFGSGNSATGGEAVPIAWGNAHVSGGH